MGKNVARETNVEAKVNSWDKWKIGINILWQRNDNRCYKEKRYLEGKEGKCMVRMK